MSPGQKYQPFCLLVQSSSTPKNKDPGYSSTVIDAVLAHAIEPLTYCGSHSLSVLGWYIPGLSELPLRNRLPSLLEGPSLRVFIFSLPLGTLCAFFLVSSFVSCACVYSEYDTAGEPGAVAGVGGCWRVEGGCRERVRRFRACSRRRVCLETRGEHEWALSGLHL